jgi:[ribosomal protein S5]-alanine N-acetyltransferase
MTLILRQANIQQLYKLLERPEHPEIDGLRMPMGEAIVPDFLIEFLIDRLNQEPENSFWWSPWFLVVESLVNGVQHQLAVGMIGFKNAPGNDGIVEIGYGIVPSQQNLGFATQAVDLIVREGFSNSEVTRIEACTMPYPTASGRVLEKNKFVRDGSKIDPDDGEVWVWRRTNP